MNYRNKNNGHIISESDYLRLPTSERFNYTPVYESVTHSLDDSDDSLTTALVISSLLSSSDNDFSSSSSDFSSSDSSISDSGSSFDFGGGDSGGAGAGGDW